MKRNIRQEDVCCRFTDYKHLSVVRMAFAGEWIVTPAMIVLRIALSFMMYRHNRWAFCNALLYAAMYIGVVFNMPHTDLASEPIIKVVYIFCCLIGYSDWVVKAFNCRNDMPIETALYLPGTIRFMANPSTHNLYVAS